MTPWQPRAPAGSGWGWCSRTRACCGNHAVLAAVASEEAKTRFATDGLTPMPYTPEQFAAFIKEDAAPWERTLKALNIQPQ